MNDHAHDPRADANIMVAGAPIDGARAVLIVLHGRGASAADGIEIGRLIAPPETAILAPQASGHTWYPLSFLAPIEQNQPFLDSALALIDRMIAQCRAAKIGPERTLIAGFSQGACLACEFTARRPDAVAAAAIMTGGLIGSRIEEARYPRAEHAPHILLTSGDPDPHVPTERVRASADLLTERGFSVTTQLYPGRPHTVSRPEVDAAHRLFVDVL